VTARAAIKAMGINSEASSIPLDGSSKSVLNDDLIRTISTVVYETLNERPSAN